MNKLKIGLLLVVILFLNYNINVNADNFDVGKQEDSCSNNLIDYKYLKVNYAGMQSSMTASITLKTNKEYFLYFSDGCAGINEENLKKGYGEIRYQTRKKTYSSNNNIYYFKEYGCFGYFFDIHESEEYVDVLFTSLPIEKELEEIMLIEINEEMETHFLPFEHYIPKSYVKVTNKKIKIQIEVGKILNEDFFYNHLLILDRENVFVKKEKDTYYNNYNFNKVGNYELIYEVRDDNNNESSVLFSIDVVDIIPPTITGPIVIVTQLSKPQLTHEDILAYFTVSDNYDSAEDIKLKVLENNYDKTPNVPKNYDVIIEATDSSQNVTTKKITLSVRDDIKPELNLKPDSRLVFYTSVGIPKESEFIKLFEAYDNVDKDISSQIQVSESTPLNSLFRKAGKFQITVRVSDGFDNKTEKTFEVIMIDDESPELYFKSITFQTDVNIIFSNEDIIEMVRQQLASNHIDAQEITIIDNQYNNTNIEGEYKIILQYKNSEEYHQQIVYIMVSDKHKEKKNAYIKTGIFTFVTLICLLSISIIVYRKKRKVI